MSRTVLALLLVLDVAATALVVAYLLRWWRSRPVMKEGGPATLQGVVAELSEVYPVPAPREAAVPTLTVLPSTPFVPPPRPQRSSGRGLGALYT